MSGTHSWDPERYLVYADERGRPFVELLARIDARSPRLVVDLGCGPGNMRPALFIAAAVLTVASLGVAQKQSGTDSQQTSVEEVIKKLDDERIQAQIHDQQVGPVQPAAPGDRDGGDERQERHGDEEREGDLLGPGLRLPAESCVRDGLVQNSGHAGGSSMQGLTYLRNRNLRPRHLQDGLVPGRVKPS